MVQGMRQRADVAELRERRVEVKVPCPRFASLFTFHFLPSTCYFNSTDQYALSTNVFHDWYLRWVSLRLRSGLRLGFSGLRMRLMWACLGVRPPLRTLQLTQAQTMLSQVLWPPWLRGMTWSRLSSVVGYFRPQYWHWLLSRAKMLRRLNFTVALGNFS